MAGPVIMCILGVLFCLHCLCCLHCFCLHCLCCALNTSFGALQMPIIIIYSNHFFFKRRDIFVYIPSCVSIDFAFENPDLKVFSIQHRLNHKEHRLYLGRAITMSYYMYIQMLKLVIHLHLYSTFSLYKH